MSLILDALKKLDREKDAREPGVLVVGSVPWGGGSRSRRPLALALGAAGLVALAVVGWLALRPTPRPPSASPLPPQTTAPVATAPPPTAPAAPPVPAASAPPLGATAAAIAPPLRPPLTVAPPPAGGEAAAPAETRPPAQAPAPRPAGDLQLNAITRRDGRAVALINDRLVFEGDSFDGVKVLRIGEDEVEVEVRGQRRVLRF